MLRRHKFSRRQWRIIQLHKMQWKLLWFICSWNYLWILLYRSLGLYKWFQNHYHFRHLLIWMHRYYCRNWSIYRRSWIRSVWIFIWLLRLYLLWNWLVHSKFRCGNSLNCLCWTTQLYSRFVLFVLFSHWRIFIWVVHLWNVLLRLFRWLLWL